MEYENTNFFYGLLIEDLIMGCERGGDFLKTKIDYCKYGIFDMDFGPHSRSIPLEKRVDWSDLEPLMQCLESRGVSRSQICEIPDGDPVNKGAYCRLEYVIHLKSYDFYFGRMENRIIEGAVNEWRFDTTIDTFDNLADFLVEEDKKILYWQENKLPKWLEDAQKVAKQHQFGFATVEAFLKEKIGGLGLVYSVKKSGLKYIKIDINVDDYHCLKCEIGYGKIPENLEKIYNDVQDFLNGCYKGKIREE